MSESGVRACGGLCGRQATRLPLCVQVKTESEKARPNAATLGACPARAHAVLLATARVAQAAAALHEATGELLTLRGAAYPGPGALGAGHLAEFCDRVERVAARGAGGGGGAALEAGDG